MLPASHFFFQHLLCSFAPAAAARRCQVSPGWMDDLRCLVGGFNPSEKYSNWVIFLGEKIKNDWNHHQVVVHCKSSIKINSLLMWSGWQMWTVSFERIFLAASSTTVLASLATPELSTACYHRAKVRTLGNTFSIDQQNITYQYITSIQSFQPTVAVRWTKLVIWNCSLVAFSSMGFSEKKPPARAASVKIVPETMKQQIDTLHL